MSHAFNPAISVGGTGATGHDDQLRVRRGWASKREERCCPALGWIGGEKQRSFRVYRPFQCLSKLAVRSHLQHLEQVGVVLLLLLIIILLIFLLSLSFTFDLGFSTCIF